MTRAVLLFALVAAVGSFAASAAQTPAPTTAAAEVTECAQAQMVVERLLQAANLRIEAARQANNPADMRAAVDGLQSTLRDVRAQLAPCAKLQPSDLHGPHVMPKPPMTSAAAPVTPVAAQSKPPAAKPPATDPHAGHAAAPAAPAAKPPTTPAPPAAKPAPKPAATDPHAGHAPSAPAATARPLAPAQPPPKSPAEAVDPVCGLKVDPATAPNATVQGRAYFFCSDRHQQLFQKNPAKYLPRGQ